MRVCTCPQCQTVIRDNPLWVGSRFDLNADYMKWQDALTQLELKNIVKALEFSRNFESFIAGPNTYYRRGKGGKYLYRVPNEDFRVCTEKRKAYSKGKQARLPIKIVRNKQCGKEKQP